MKALIVYASRHKGNTEKIAKAMQKPLNADIVKAQDATLEKIKEYGLIGFGSGIYGGRHDKSILNLLKKIDKLETKTFVFSTSQYPAMSFFSHLQLKTKLKMLKADVVGEFSCAGYNTHGPYALFGGSNKGRPGRKDIQEAKEFAKRMGGQLQ